MQTGVSRLRREIKAIKDTVGNWETFLLAQKFQIQKQGLQEIVK